MRNNKILNLYIFLSGLLIALFILAYFSIYIKGQYTALILSWIWIIITTYVIIKFWKSKLMKIYTLILGLLTFGSIVPMAIPFIMIISFLFNLNTKATYKLDETYRIDQKQYLLDREKLYVNKKTADYLILEKVDAVGYITYDDIISEFKINQEEYLAQSIIQKISKKGINNNSIILSITVNNKTKDFEIPFK